MQKVLNKRKNKIGSKPSANEMEYGEIAINYSKGGESLFIKNDNDEVVDMATISIDDETVASGKTWSSSKVDSILGDIDSILTYIIEH